MSNPTFTFLSNNRIAELIAAGGSRVIYAAPNLSKAIADKLLLIADRDRDISIRVHY
jgi:hypothetical protein